MQLPDGKIRIIKPSRAYTVNDIINVVVDTYKKSWRQCESIAQSFAADTEQETCRKINDYVVANIDYKEDGIGYQHVKTPARLIHSGFGDCKSIAILVASILTCLRIPCKFRFVCLSGDEIGHVYVVTDSGINIDPVEVICNRRQFNEVSPYKFKKDMQANGLAVLSGVGSAAPFKAFLNETNSLDNTRAENYLLSCIDLQFSILNVDPSNVEAINKCALLIVAYALYNESANDSALLNRSASVLQQMYNDGHFSLTYKNDQQTSADLESLISTAINFLNSDLSITSTGSWYEWFRSKIIAENHSNVTTAQRNYIQQKTAVGAVSSELADNIKAAGGAFLYRFASKNNVASLSGNNPVVAAKRNAQIFVSKKWKSAFSDYYTPDTIDNLLMSGCIQAFQGTPDQVVNVMAKEGAAAINGVVWNTIKKAFAWLFDAVVDVAKWFVGLFKGAVEENVEAKQKEEEVKETLDLINQGQVVPSQSDITVKDNTSAASFGNALPFVLLAGAAISLFVGNKKKTNNSKN